MKKTFKSVSFITTLFFILSVLLGLTAFSASASEDDFSSAVLAYIEQTQKGDDTVPDNIQLDGSVALLDSNNEIAARCFFLKPAGYVIIRNDYLIAEAAFSDTKSAQMLREHAGENIYYGGALTYFTQDTAEEYTEILSNTEVSSEEAVATIQSAEEIAQLSTATMAKSTSIQPAATLSFYIRGSLREGWDYNPDGRCGATAAAITLAYFADYIDSWVVPSWHMTSNGQSLTELLTPWIHPTDSAGNATGGAYAEDVVDGFNTYFRWRAISDRYTAFFRSASVLNSTLLDYVVDEGIPVVTMINGHPTYGNHFVVSHGVVTNSSMTSVSQVIVNDGWGSNNIRISLSYCVAAAVMTAK